MHKRTRACAISQKTKQAVWKRDKGRCIFCGSYKALPEAHVLSRAHGGKGIPQNIVTVCRKCHDLMDNSTRRPEMVAYAETYLRQFYPEWREQDMVYDKWGWMKGNDGK